MVKLFILCTTGHGLVIIIEYFAVLRSNMDQYEFETFNYFNVRPTIIHYDMLILIVGSSETRT